ncbi:MAG: hypothetical protein ACYTF3_04800, partial [Planctomycetota bacterium]
MKLESSILAAAGLLAALTTPLAAQEEAPTTTETGQDPAAAGEEAFAHLDPEAAITVNFQDEDLGEILELFSTNYELNLVYG